ncbi:MAG: hypothetical protein MZV64_24055 [Ignavibacteriales bacterium]|nr:hypothetical protein [Ignavibacteriales bacterium]
MQANGSDEPGPHLGWRCPKHPSRRRRLQPRLVVQDHPRFRIGVRPRQRWFRPRCLLSNQRAGIWRTICRRWTANTVSGSQIIIRVAQNYSVNPRLLVAAA